MASCATMAEPRVYWPTQQWQAASPRSQGMDADLLHHADRHIREHLPNVYSLLVVKHGYIVFEQYYQGHTQTDTYSIRSVTKSVTAALIGIAFKEQLISGLDQKI